MGTVQRRIMSIPAVVVLALALGMVLMTIVLVVNALAQASRDIATRAGA